MVVILYFDQINLDLGFDFDILDVKPDLAELDRKLPRF